MTATIGVALVFSALTPPVTTTLGYIGVHIRRSDTVVLPVSQRAWEKVCMSAVPAHTTADVLTLDKAVNQNVKTCKQSHAVISHMLSSVTCSMQQHSETQGSVIAVYPVIHVSEIKQCQMWCVMCRSPTALA